MDGEDSFDVGDFIHDDFFQDSGPGIHTDDKPTSAIDPPSNPLGKPFAFDTSHFPPGFGDVPGISTTPHHSHAGPSTHHPQSVLSEYADHEDLQDETQRLDLEIKKIELQIQKIRV
jgi:hypothetical protein